MVESKLQRVLLLQNCGIKVSREGHLQNTISICATVKRMKDLPWNAKQSTERRQMSPRLSSAQWGARASHYVKCFICKFKFLIKGTHCNSIIRWQGSHHSLKRDFFGKLFCKRDTLRPSSFLRLKNGGEKIACILWFSQIWKNYRIHDGEFDHQKDSAIFGIHNTSQKKIRSS